MVLYILGFIPIALLLTHFNYTGNVFLAVTACVGVAWLALSVAGFRRQDNTLWGKQMFQLSLVMIGIICLTISFDKV